MYILYTYGYGAVLREARCVESWMLGCAIRPDDESAQMCRPASFSGDLGGRCSRIYPSLRAAWRPAEI